MEQNSANLAQVIIEAGTLIVLLSGLIALSFQKKQIHFSTVKKCIDDYRNIVRQQQRYCYNTKNQRNTKELEILARDHLGLVSEELFYMEKNYLPKPIAKEWLADMIRYIPIYTRENPDAPINKSEIHKSKELKQFIYCWNSGYSNNYDKYLETAKSFKKVHRKFKIDEKILTMLDGDKEDIDLENPKNRQIIVNNIWSNI